MQNPCIQYHLQGGMTLGKFARYASGQAAALSFLVSIASDGGTEDAYAASTIRSSGYDSRETKHEREREGLSERSSA